MLGQSKPNLIGNNLYKGGTNVFINNQGHMTKMVACPYMVKTLQKCSSPEPMNRVQGGM